MKRSKALSPSLASDSIATVADTVLSMTICRISNGAPANGNWDTGGSGLSFRNTGGTAMLAEWQKIVKRNPSALGWLATPPTDKSLRTLLVLKDPR